MMNQWWNERAKMRSVTYSGNLGFSWSIPFDTVWNNTGQPQFILLFIQCILYIILYTYTYVYWHAWQLEASRPRTVTWAEVTSSDDAKYIVHNHVSSRYHSMYLLTGWICIPCTAHKLIFIHICIIITCVWCCYCMCTIKHIFVRASCWEASWSLAWVCASASCVSLLIVCVFSILCVFLVCLFHWLHIGGSWGGGELNCKHNLNAGIVVSASICPYACMQL